ncbi:transcription initiation factor TFIID subunit 5 [Trichomonascus vanleenenianus]|uniref:chromatin modification protein n=1 Tax=Trichomonascus vanleenenianus TaxID=2268995 RepID=UPI003EC9FB17
MANDKQPPPQPQVGGVGGQPVSAARPMAAGQPQQQQQQQQPGAARPAQTGVSDLNRIVLEYLNKKGYTRTEAMLRIESSRTPTPAGGSSTTSASANTAGRPISRGATPLSTKPDEDPEAYLNAYASLKRWAENSLDLYRPELRRVCYPIFVHLFLDLIHKNHPSVAKRFFDEYSVDFMVLHGQDIEKLSAVSLPAHLEENDLAKAFRTKKYQLRVSRTSFDLLLYFLHEIETNGGSIIIRLLNQYVDTTVSTTRPSRYDTELSLDPNEGLPGYSAAASGEQDHARLPAVKLGKMPMDPDLAKEVQVELEKREDGPQLVDELNKRVKLEPSEDSPARESLPLPQYKAVDVSMEVRNVADTRNRITIGATGQAALPSVCMYTFHNTHDGLNCISFSDDSELVAGGFSDSFVKVWSLKGSKLTSVIKSDPENEEATSSRRLIGHAGAVFGTSFSPDNRFLLSSSEDKTVRLWSLDTYTALVSYRGHNHPVWDVAFGPFGHYFATASHDQTARLWSCDHIHPLRIFAGHLSDVDCVSFHPNGTYLITGSSDKSCRMWDINRGNSVRVFMGHTQPVNTTAVSPDGRWMASAGEDGVINVWDLGSGRRLKCMRGHGKASIYSLAFSREGSVLVSCGADNSVRVWDIKRGTNDSSAQPEPMEIISDSSKPTSNGTTSSGTSAASSGSSTAGTRTRGTDSSKSAEDNAKRRKEVVATPDHLVAFHTKKTPVYKVHFTRRNLCLAAGAYMG